MLFEMKSDFKNIYNSFLIISKIIAMVHVEADGCSLTSDGTATKFSWNTGLPNFK